MKSQEKPTWGEVIIGSPRHKLNNLMLRNYTFYEVAEAVWDAKINSEVALNAVNAIMNRVGRGDEDISKAIQLVKDGACGLEEG